MKFSNLQTTQPRSPGRKALAALVLASVVGGLFISTAYADNDGHNNGNGNGHSNQGQKGQSGNQGNHGDDDHHGNRNVYYGYRPDYRPPYYYAQPVYVPPPVYYQPWQSPGINLIFPLDLR